MESSIHVTFRCDSEIERKIRIEAAKLDMNRTEFIIASIIEKLGRINAEGAQDQTESH